MIKTWSYVEEYKDLRKRILNSIDKTLKSGELFFGKQLELFEKNFLKDPLEVEPYQFHSYHTYFNCPTERLNYIVNSNKVNP